MCYFVTQSTWDRIPYSHVIFLHRGEPFTVEATHYEAIVVARLEKLDWDQFHIKTWFSEKRDTDVILFTDIEIYFGNKIDLFQYNADSSEIVLPDLF